MSVQIDNSGFDLFWSECLALYERAGVKHSLLDLQDRLQLDVCVLLLSCWSMKAAARLWDEDQVKDIQRLIQNWQNPIVGQIRRLRNQLKSSSQFSIPDETISDLRAKLLDWELEAEKAELNALYHIVDRKEGGDGQNLPLSEKIQIGFCNILAAHNLTGRDLHERQAMTANLEVLFSQVFKISKEDIRQFLLAL